MPTFSAMIAPDAMPHPHRKLMPISIGFHEAHIWVVDPASIAPERRAAYRHVLSSAERLRMARFHHSRDREAHLISRGLLRTALSWSAPEVEPQHWRFIVNRYGRPEICNFGPDLPLRFNISHTAGLIACLITRGADCGVDAELIDRDTMIEEIGPSVLCPREMRRLSRAGAEAKRLFFCFWTLKEAYAKARGIGMSLRFDRFEFDVSETGIKLLIDPSLDPAPTTWCFRQWRPTPHHTIAVALGRNHSGAEHILVNHEALPPVDPGRIGS